MKIGMVIVVPTRNRADLAITAIRSVLAQSFDGLHVLVSDNSTSAEEKTKLSGFCAGLADERLRYIAPPQPLPMSAHWQWAMQQALSLYDATHFTCVTDRMILKPGALEKLERVISEYPDSVVSYMHDRIIDDQTPIRIQLFDWSGDVFQLDSRRLLYLVSESQSHPSLPRMLNCLVPRRLLNDLQQRFGAMFSSLSPDFSFCFRTLAIEDSILYLDESLLVHYALERSNGASAARGEMTKDHADFLADVGQRNIFFATPAPAVTLVHNAIIHEYNLARKETNSVKFPDVNRAKYLERLAQEVEDVLDPDLRRKLTKHLARAGHYESQLQLTNGPLRKIFSPKRMMYRLKQKRKHSVSPPAASNGSVPRQRPLGSTIVSGPAEGIDFRNVEAALNYACVNPLPRSENFSQGIKLTLQAQRITA
jgi:hypothetical protein